MFDRTHNAKAVTVQRSKSPEAMNCLTIARQRSLIASTIVTSSFPLDGPAPNDTRVPRNQLGELRYTEFSLVSAIAPGVDSFRLKAHASALFRGTRGSRAVGAPTVMRILALQGVPAVSPVSCFLFVGL
jgi:hypothetical protein